MKLYALLSLLYITCSTISFGMQKCPNHKPGLPVPHPYALHPDALANNNHADQNESVRPSLQRFRTAYVMARAERRPYPATALAEINAIIETIPYEDAETRRNFSSLKDIVLEYNEKFQ